MSDQLIDVCASSKKFCRDLKTSLAYGVRDIAREMVGSRGTGRSRLRHGEFWAVRDISFEVRRGDCLGLIGPNGSGKSTLLKMINGILKPDIGRISVRGRVSALIELGAGFSPILTGRENIYVNGSVLGMTTTEVDAKLDEIIHYSGIEEFIDMPVRSYSSGMRVRLGFAIAAHVDTDVLLIDEVLAVGDVGFKQRCFNTMANLAKDRAIIFVSHNMANIARIATSVLVMNSGEGIIHTPDVGSAIQQYFEQFPAMAGSRIGEHLVHLRECRVPGAEDDAPTVRYGEALVVELEYAVLGEDEPDVIHLKFFDKGASQVAVSYVRIPSGIAQIDGYRRLRVRVRDFPLSAGRYSIGIIFAEAYNDTVNGKIIAHYVSAITLRVVGSETISNISVQLPADVLLDEEYTEARSPDVRADRTLV